MKKEEKIEKLAGEIIKLPPEGQRAMDFMIKNFDIIKNHKVHTVEKENN